MNAVVPFSIPSEVPSLCQTTCPYCGVGCGIDLQLTQNASGLAISDLKGMSEHPANFGRLCVKGSNLLQTNDLTNRLLVPQINDLEVSWQQAIATVGKTFSEVIERFGQDALAFYVSGQLLTEDYYVANKLMKGYIGSANIDTNSRLCMSSAVAAYQRAFGADAVPCCYEDLEQTDLLVLVGSNAAWTHPVLYQRIERAKKLRPNLQVVVIDPRRTASCAIADLHLAIKPGTDVALFNGLLSFLAQTKGLDDDFINRSTEGFVESLDAARLCSETVAHCCEIEPQSLMAFYRAFAGNPRVITFYSMGVNQSSQGVDKANAIINCHLASGKIGKVGCGPFSITGQPNAMGGREVGGLANMLAAHMQLENPQHRQWVQQHWQSPTIASKAGFKALELFERVAEGEVKALWIMATNPLVSLPNRALVERALQRAECVVVSDCVANNDTLRFAHIKLPASGWSEKNGTVTNSERRISRQRGVLPPPGQARHDWQIICKVAQAMGYQGFDYEHPAEIFLEHARLSGLNNDGSRAFDISNLARLSIEEYDQLSPVQWPVTASRPQGTKRLFEDGHFYNSSGKARLIPVRYQAPIQQTNTEFPYVLNSGRVRDQWHTMTRTSKAHSLLQHRSKPLLSIHPLDAEELGVSNNQWLELSARFRSHRWQKFQVSVDSSQRRGEFFVPIHWSATHSSDGAVGTLFDTVCDPISGQPELKHGAVRARSWEPKWCAILVSKQPYYSAALADRGDFFVYRASQYGHVLVLAGDDSKPWQALLKQHAQAMHYALLSDSHGSFFAVENEQLQAVLIEQTKPFKEEQEQGLVAWIDSLLGQSKFDLHRTSDLLNGQPDSEFLLGPLVCQCFQVRQKTINQAINRGCRDAESLGHELHCGTKCGSCKPELQQLIAQSVKVEEAV